MSRGGRLVIAVLAAALVASGVAGCGRFDAKPVQVAPVSNAGDCVVGSWKQTEGWQRITTDDKVYEVRLIDGGRLFDVKADGTGTVRYLDPTSWKTAGSGDDLEVIYAGSLTLTYTASGGKWSQNADTTKATTQLTLNDYKDPPAAGGVNRASTSTYVCDDTNLIMTSDDFRQAFTRV
jgi:hypothetical protein